MERVGNRNGKWSGWEMEMEDTSGPTFGEVGNGAGCCRFPTLGDSKDPCQKILC